MPKKKQSAAALAIAPTAEERQKKIADIVAASGKMFGEGALGTLKGKHSIRGEVLGVIDSGSIGLNQAIGIGGYPRGRVIEIYGAESSGKTTLTLHAIAEAQKAGGIAAFIDAEHALDPTYAEGLGVDLEELLLFQPKHGEEALNMVETLVRTGDMSIVVVDSVAALVPKAEVEGDMGDIQPGLQARLMSQAMRKLTGIVHTSNTTVIFINQVRMKIGVRFGSPKTTSGGEALKFYSSVRLEVARIAGLKRGDDAFGNRVRVTVKKNKVSPPFKKCEFDIVFGEGVSWSSELLDYCIEKNLIKKAGSWYSYEETRIGQGRQSAENWLKENADVAAELKAKVLS
jgi:recombination protein RecA